MLDEVEPVPAPAALWGRIEEQTGASRSNVIALRRRVTVWRGLTGATTALAASPALVVVNRQVPPSPVADRSPDRAGGRFGAARRRLTHCIGPPRSS